MSGARARGTPSGLEAAGARACAPLFCLGHVEGKPPALHNSMLNFIINATGYQGEGGAKAFELKGLVTCCSRIRIPGRGVLFRAKRERFNTF